MKYWCLYFNTFRNALGFVGHRFHLVSNLLFQLWALIGASPVGDRNRRSLSSWWSSFPRQDIKILVNKVYLLALWPLHFYILCRNSLRQRRCGNIIMIDIIHWLNLFWGSVDIEMPSILFFRWLYFYVGALFFIIFLELLWRSKLIKDVLWLRVGHL